jgi:prepilin-type N-terminal cleavage/methylation domain-containing protein
MKHKHKKFQRGFTLIETLIAVLILTIAIAGPLTIASKGLTGTLIAKDQITAFYLAQDAMEYIRFVRDTNALSGGNWLTGAGGSGTFLKDLTPCASADGSKSCVIDTLQSTIAQCVGSCPTLRYDTTNNSFDYTGAATPGTRAFVRSIVITTPIGGSADEARVDISVGWSDIGLVAHTITVREHLLNWNGL